MEETTGTQNNRIIGIGMRTDKETGSIEPVTNFYPSYFRNVVRAFEAYPITKFFGITIKDAMQLPVDEWHEIRKSAKDLKEKHPADTETQLMQLLKEMMAVREVGG